jgi:hypothetical protein
MTTLRSQFKASSLPVRSAKKVTLMINPGTATQLGLIIPPEVMGAGQAVK